MKPFYISSTGSGLSATVAGFSVAGVVEAIVLVLGVLGYHVDQSFLMSLVTDLAQAVSLAVALFGLLRKVYYTAKHILENLKTP